MNKIIYNIGLVIVLLLVSIGVNAMGFGVTQPGTISITPGESEIVEFSVQTGAGDKEDVMAKLVVIKGHELVELIEPVEYLVPASGETTAKIKINMPENAKPEDIWDIVLEFKASPVNEESRSGTIALGYGVEISFDVVASEPQVTSPPIPTGEVTRETKYNSAITPIVIVIVVLIVAYFLLRKKPKKPSRKKK